MSWEYIRQSIEEHAFSKPVQPKTTSPEYEAWLAKIQSMTDEEWEAKKQADVKAMKAQAMRTAAGLDAQNEARLQEKLRVQAAERAQNEQARRTEERRLRIQAAEQAAAEAKRARAAAEKAQVDAEETRMKAEAELAELTGAPAPPRNPLLRRMRV